MGRPIRVAKKKTDPNPDPVLSKVERHRQSCAVYRERVKADPVKYAAFKKKNAEQKREARLRATPEQRAAEKENARLRQALFRERKKAKEALVASGGTHMPIKPPETRSDSKKTEERRRKNTLAQQKRRAKMSAQKKRRERERNLKYIQDKRGTPKRKVLVNPPTSDELATLPADEELTVPPTQEETTSPPAHNELSNPSIPEGCTVGVSRATMWRVKRQLGKGNNFVVSLKNLVKSAFKKQPEKLQEHGVVYKSPSKTPAARADLSSFLNSKRDKASLTVKRLFNSKDTSSLYKRRKEKDAGAALSFFQHRSIQIPGKQGVTKKGPRKILDRSIKTLHKEFIKEHGPIISRATFFRKRPHNVLSFTKTPFRQCLCEICINPMLSMKTLNQHITGARIETLSDLIHFTICSENLKCIRRECDKCGVCSIDSLIENIDGERLVEWQRWERVSKNGSTRLDLVKKNTSLFQLSEQLKEDLDKLPLHDFIHRWQSCQYRNLVSDIPDGWAVLTMDFSENYLCRQQDQPQSAYFGYSQVTVHPCVLYYRCTCGMRMTENWTFLSDVLTHSSSMVDVIMKKVVNHVCHLSSISKLVIFSDGCSSQYKSKLPFFFLSNFTDCGINIERCYFGARHGKNPCDALGGLLKQAASRAVQSRRAVIQNAVDLLNFAKETLEKNEQDCTSNKSCHSSRFYFLLKEDEIQERDSSGLKTVLGTREIHSIQPTRDGLLSRNLSCFCSFCIDFDYTSCSNKKFVHNWQNITVKGVRRVSSVPAAKLDTAFLAGHNESLSVTCDTLSPQNPEKSSSEHVTRPLPVSRDEFFSQSQTLISQCNSFDKLEESIHAIVSGLQSYPLPKLVFRSMLDCPGSVDASALRLRPENLKDLYPFLVEADGNCMPRSLSVLVFGTQAHHVEVRVRIVAEMVLNKARYLCREKNDLDMLAVLSDHYSGNVDATYKSEVLDICHLGSYMGMWQLKAATNVFAANILSVYPSLGQQCFRTFFNVKLKPDCHSDRVLIIFWSSLRDDMTEEYWVANHVVPMLPMLPVSEVEVVETP